MFHISYKGCENKSVDFKTIDAGGHNVPALFPESFSSMKNGFGGTKLFLIHFNLSENKKQLVKKLTLL